MLTAYQARAIASNPYIYVWDRIEEAAHNSKFEVVFDHYLDAEIVDNLRLQGYNVQFMQEDVYEDTPYGNTDKVISCKFKTIISWMEPK